MNDRVVAKAITDILRDVTSAKEAVMINMVFHGLLPSRGWTVGHRLEVADSGDVIQDFVPVCSKGSVGEEHKEVRPELGVRIVIRAPR